MSANVLRILARLAGLAVLAGGLGVAIGLLHRWYASDRVPEGLSVLVGLSGVALSLNTTIALGEVIGGDLGALDIQTALLNVATFVAAALTASAGGRAGDRLGESVLTLSGAGKGERDVSAIVRSVGRGIVVHLPDAPDDVGDIEGYDPVDPEVKAKLAGRTLVFPRRLTVEELRDRFVARLVSDYGVGHVDVEFSEEGDVEYLALGSREAGLGPTLPPETAAVAVRADPAPAVSPGDVVQVWSTDEPADGAIDEPTEGTTDEPAEGTTDEPAEGTTDEPAEGTTDEPAARPDPPDPKRVATAEVRGATGDVVTLAVDADDTGRLDSDSTYRLVTLPVEPRADREFAAVLRAAEETMGAVTVAEDSALDGTPVGGLDVAVVAVRGDETGIETIPSRSRILAAGETLYVVARPETLRRLEDAASARPAGPIEN